MPLSVALNYVLGHDCKRVCLSRSAEDTTIKNVDVSLETLRAQVTSKGGTTFAAISKFEELNLKDSVSAAMDACVARAEEMQKLF